MVNERLPVKLQEMERHWQVNCEQTWKTLLLRAQQAAQTEACSTPPELLKALKLCAYIYQPPGTEPGQHCPDYRAASGHLEKEVPEDDAADQQCTALRTLLSSVSDGHCVARPPL